LHGFDCGLSCIRFSIAQFADKLGDALKKTAEEASTVEVATYLSNDIGEARYENGTFTGAELRALTHISLSGNTAICIPAGNNKVDEVVWKIHSEMVEKAVASRLELLKVAASAVGGIVEALRLV
jgi:hypothetical protein